MNNELTVIIPTKDRKRFLYRWMSYANKIKFPFKLFIADGGRNNEMYDYFSTTKSYPNIDYEYVKYPYDESYNIFLLKIVNALKQVTTPYVALTNDDDFYFPGGLEMSLEFLKSNPDYSSCRGSIGAFHPATSSKLIDHNDTYSDNINYFINDTSSSIIDETALGRMKNHFSHYTLTFYDVHRTEELLFAYKETVDLNIKNIFLVELITSFLTVYSGKVKRLNNLFLFRQERPIDSASNNYYLEHGDSFDQMLSDSWSDDINKFINKIASVISSEDSINHNVAKEEVKKYYRKKVTSGIIKTLSYDISVKKKYKFRILATIKSIVKRFDYNGIIKNNYNSLLKKRKYKVYKRNNKISLNENSELNILLDFLSNPPSNGIEKIT